ncbi:hypothetical protein KCV03_g62, partial [Aureobasidium melanogenum]
MTFLTSFMGRFSDPVIYQIKSTEHQLQPRHTNGMSMMTAVSRRSAGRRHDQWGIFGIGWVAASLRGRLALRRVKIQGDNTSRRFRMAA